MSLPSAEVAADFKDALQDLKTNSRPEISNLTIIAKENTEHAQAISRELEGHIRTTRPEWRLPALYVLDSIVKNVGTPYTVYLGRNLYRTFMDSYMLMDEPTRKAMEGLLKTWKQPVPESMDPRPVFPPEVTRDIETALIKYRTVAVQQAQRVPKPLVQHGGPPRPMNNTPWRDTPTPPQNGGRYTPSNDPRVRQTFPPQYGNQYSPHGAPGNQFPIVGPAGAPPPSPSVSLETITSDLDKLINAAKSEWALSPQNVSIQEKLKNLLALQTILKTQTLLPDQLKQIHKQVLQLSTPPAPPPSVPAVPAMPVPPPVVPSPQLPAAPSFPPSNTPLNLAQILANARVPAPHAPTPPNPSLADLLRRTTSPAQTGGTPAAVASFFPPPSAPPVPAVPLPAPASAAPTPVATPSLAQILQQFGNPQAAPVPTPTPPVLPIPLPQLLSQPPPPPAAPVGGADWLLAALKAQNLIPPTGTPTFPPLPGVTPLSSTPMARSGSGTGGQNDVELTTASMKKPRHGLIFKLYEAFPNQCVTCGRRFESTSKGKERKARHMDWHFKVKDPDIAKRGIHRSWYISESEWIDYREVDEAAPETALNGVGGAGGSNAQKKETKDQYIPVPTDPTLVHAPCPICQEKFQPQWHVEANDFVWMDAIKVNSKIYHATCWEEYSGGIGTSNSIAKPGTPDSVLGKRKAEVAPGSAEKKARAH